MMNVKHPFHLVDRSPWPLTSSLGALMTTSGLVVWFNFYEMSLLGLGLLSLLLSMIQWWRDVVRESTYQGCHTLAVQVGMKWGMILFIVSEVLFFFSFFWAFFHSSLSPSPDLGAVWPPTGVDPFNPFDIPLLNTVILLSSGATITWAHHCLIEGDHSSGVSALGLTVLLGVYFTALQVLEYSEASFNISDSVYGATFFVATGFHGLHVIIGSLFLSVSWFRLAKGHFSPHHHFGLEAAAWYWHFVDVVWLFLYVSIYWWGS
uniref:Cytochrome c oxidase subunit 3 n=1 Tax=Pleurocryptella fimbriata TaxID=2480055 RepID=A0A8K1Y3K0_9CRUS|nr:cytochrome c oxidase subunit III [Pleurocryptella fimbriata]